MGSDHKPQGLYHHRGIDVYECLGCGQMIEVPGMGVMRAGQMPENVARNPENRMIWLELQELDHAACGRFRDVKMAEDARRFRHPLLRMPAPRGDDGPPFLGPQTQMAQ